ncbi:acyl-CoA dehydrogenase family protein [Nonomuraea rhodomycinica]|uniref:Acyl-CoA/acyl-ACP dehydrogenase n=1 Tax=Nonomuraea rhodomycinica TaxID=1712872 RepID=A0A7Y6ILT0_9ACTN|nr:acyl-CoA dehydrogenase family protein [Nonomuraea rhodomycinica]NUW40515.1 acyl-CoA/acyl-ACP dehydrogenase [Nonomuraea rhodomycinica]
MTVTDELRDVVRSYLADRPGASWGTFARELGVAGLAVPEEYGGAGCGPAEVAAVAEELGRALSPHPFLQSAVLAVEAVKAGGDAAAMARLLPVLAGGRSATVALPGDGDLVLEDGLLSGVVPYAPAGDLVLVYAAGLLVEAEPTRRAPHRTLDESRPLEELTFERVPVRPAGDGAGWTRVRDLGVAALAAEQTGGAARCLEMATAHARARHQFGRPIGSFQAVKHKLADLLLLVESARSAALGAAEAGAAGLNAADLDGADLEEAAAIAGSYCSEAYLTAAGENIQLHGGIGVTWEHPAHRYFKRATSDAQLFGPPQAHRARLAARVLGQRA